MSEYWKSTPKYWCKHCKIYVRDTKLEKSNHEATPRHQGNIKRFLRDLHRGQEKDERDKERAKKEVERVNGIVAGSSASGSGSGDGNSFSSITAPKPQATPLQRKQQLAQLAEMGVSIPDEFRGDLAMVGEWQVLEEKVIEGGDGKRGVEGVGIGVRKREAEKEDEDEEERVVKRGKWGSQIRTYPGRDGQDGLDELLSKPMGKGKGTIRPIDIKTESTADTANTAEEGNVKVEDLKEKDVVKREPPEEETQESVVSAAQSKPVSDDAVKQETDTPVTFKKRKTKNVRQK